jgi:GNAT superfamily N-acetyltransferase
VTKHTYRLVQVPGDSQELAWLDAECFPEDTPYPKRKALWWVLRAPGVGPVAFAGLRHWPADNFGFLCRAGVIASHRGQGLQQRLIRARVRHARRAGWAGVYTYTSPENVASGNNLIKCGFSLWTPSYAWGGEDMVYWWLSLTSDRQGGQSGAQ